MTTPAARPRGRPARSGGASAPSTGAPTELRCGSLLLMRDPPKHVRLIHSDCLLGDLYIISTRPNLSESVLWMYVELRVVNRARGSFIVRRSKAKQSRRAAADTAAAEVEVED
jgi:hypothetical protein